MNYEKNMYLSQGFFEKVYKIVTKHPDYIFYRAIKIHQKYRKAKEENKKIAKIFYSFLANRISSKYNLELYGKFGKNLRIWHGNIIINGNAIIGDNCNFHGNNCIGEKNGKSPNIGDNVDVGYGTVIIGGITVANNIVIGANSLVNKSFLEEGVVIAGCPARIIKKG